MVVDLVDALEYVNNNENQALMDLAEHGEVEVENVWCVEFSELLLLLDEQQEQQQAA